MPVRRKRQRIARFEHPLGHPRQRIGAAHRARRPSDERPTWDVGEEYLGVPSPARIGAVAHIGHGPRTGRGRPRPRRPTWDVLRRAAFIVPPRRGLLLRMRGHRRIERTEDARAHLGREPPVQHHGAVVLVPEGQAPVLVLGVGPLGLLRALGPAIEPHELLHVLGGAVESDVEEVVLVLRRCDAGEGPDLGVAELALRERLGEKWQLPNARATRTFSRAVWVSMPQAQDSQWAHESAPCAAQTSRRSSSAMRTRRRYVAAWMWAARVETAAASASSSMVEKSFMSAGCNIDIKLSLLSSWETFRLYISRVIRAIESPRGFHPDFDSSPNKTKCNGDSESRTASIETAAAEAERTWPTSPCDFVAAGDGHLRGARPPRSVRGALVGSAHSCPDRSYGFSAQCSSLSGKPNTDAVRR